ncbi:outer membrane lipoprotein-sorting protein [Saccharomonospora amisosensis]|uniref:Outer membrane lipoprotein-sorting protein n=1 Tax=Saccharomonospora amisosensis TaxID=1128677 RepID=A0A7X5UMH2_9PSEU|nr:outer membrane lipoprotein carrier protein LolA [Saccharomonospora amisosensis]NIJ10725.1 outer membrane lipoprotein-sorting protein [Saccharomonospora amisosensis]
MVNPKRRAVTVAVAGTAAGAVGLALLALPAGAGEAPELPPVSAENLVESVLRADAPALSGTVELDNRLGLPTVPGMPALEADSTRVFYDGSGRSRLAIQRDTSEYTVVHGKDVLWTYDSAENTVTRTPLTHDRAAPPADSELADPATLTNRLLNEVRQSSTVAVDGTATVADRAAYELVLTPKPDERTLLREVRVAVDSETRLPLRVSAFTNGTTEPALRLGFTDISFGAQPAELFSFTPPQGAEVEQEQANGPRGPRQHGEVAPEVVGSGWDTVLLTRMPAEIDTGHEAEAGGDLRGMLEQVGQRVRGPYGSGYLIETTVATALITDDGRVAVGAVPEQVLTQALGRR